MRLLVDLRRAGCVDSISGEWIDISDKVSALPGLETRRIYILCMDSRLGWCWLGILWDVGLSDQFRLRHCRVPDVFQFALDGGYALGQGMKIFLVLPGE